MEPGDKNKLCRFLAGVLGASMLCTLPLSAQGGSAGRSRARHPQPPQSSAKLDELAQKAEAARASGHPQEALELYTQVLRSRPNWTGGWWYVGMIHYDADRYAEAIPALKKVVTLDPKSGPGWAFLGLCEFRVAKYPDALVHLEKASTLGFGDAETARVGNYHRALLLNLNEKYREASEVLRSQFGQEKLTPQIAIARGLALLHMPILPAQLDVTKKELVFSAGQASAELEHRRYEEALHLLTAIEKEHPEVPFVHYSAAKALYGLSRWEEAESQLQAELQLSPKSSESYVLLARLKLRQNDRTSAMQIARKAEALSPRDPEVHHVLSEALAAEGKLAEADRELGVAKTLGWKPSSEELEPAVTPAANATDATEVKQLQQKALSEKQAGDLDSAIATFKEALAIQPDWPEGVLNLATIYYGKEDYQDALGLARRLTKIQPNTGATWAMVGLCEFQLGEYDNALVHLNRGKSLGFPPGSGGAISEANYHIGILLNWKGEFGPAHDLLLAEAKSGDRSADAKYALGVNLLRLELMPSQIQDADRAMVQTASEIAMDLSRSDYGAATSKFDDLLKTYPGRAYIHDAYGWALMSISRYDAAAEQYRQEIRLSPNSADAYLGLATAALKTHRFEEARDSAKRAVELTPDSAMAHGQYGRALVELSDVKAGIPELEKAVQLQVAIPELHFYLSRAYAKAGRPKDAERERQIFLRLDQQNKK